MFHFMKRPMKIRVVRIIEIFIFINVIDTEKRCLFHSSQLLSPLLKSAVDDLDILMPVNTEYPVASASPLTHVLIIYKDTGRPLYTKYLHRILEIPFTW